MEIHGMKQEDICHDRIQAVVHLQNGDIGNSQSPENIKHDNEEEKHCEMKRVDPRKAGNRKFFEIGPCHLAGKPEAINITHDKSAKYKKEVYHQVHPAEDMGSIRVHQRIAHKKVNVKDHGEQGGDAAHGSKICQVRDAVVSKRIAGCHVIKVVWDEGYLCGMVALQ